jgi:hypothetical protein
MLIPKWVNLALILEHCLSLSPRIELVIGASIQNNMAGIDANKQLLEESWIEHRLNGTSHLSKGF